MRTPTFLIISFVCFTSLFSQIKKVACVGDSITHGGEFHGKSCYPSKLKEILGGKFNVKNFGRSGITLLKYHKVKEYEKLINFKADIIIIKLGTNDSTNGLKLNPFKLAYKKLIIDLKKSNPFVKVFVCTPIPIIKSKYKHIPDILAKKVVPIIKEVSRNEKCRIIDLFSFFQDKKHLLKDGLHPNQYGYKLIAEKISKYID